jgi:hypothetical protein
MEIIQMLGSLGEFVGAIAVVATLIYLTIQVRHSREAMEETSRLAKAAALGITFEHLSQFGRHIIANADVARLWREGCAGRELDEDDRTRFNALGQEVVYGMASAFDHAVAAGAEDIVQVLPAVFARRVHVEPGLLAIWEELRQSWGTEAARSNFDGAVAAALDTLTRGPEAQQ